MSDQRSPLHELPIPTIERAVAHHLRSRRQKLKISQRQLAKSLATFGIPSSRSLINKYEQGPGNGGSKLSLTATRALGLILYGEETGLLDSVESEEFGPIKQFINPDVGV